MTETSRWKPYSGYMNSGIAWLGELPQHWGVGPLKFLCSQSALYGANESATHYADEGVRFIRTTDIDDRGTLKPQGGVYLEESTISDYLLQDGDLLLSRSGTIGRSFVYREDLHGKAAYAGYLVCFRPNHTLDARYCFYFTKSMTFQDWLELSVITSTIGNVNGQKYANMPLPIPPIDEQHTIADFLDRETARIDALIAKKQRLIELLQEKRTALISHSVTKGLDAGVAMKESGVAWLGEVPAHWEIRPLRAVVQLRRGFDLTAAQREDGTVPVYSSSGLSGYHDTALVKGPGVVTGRYGTVGQIFYVEKDYWPMNTALYGKEFWGNDPRYVSFLLTILPFDAYSGKSAVPGIDRNDLDPIKVVCPPYDEQLAIADFLVRSGRKLEEAVQKVESVIKKLQEYRTALISAAVTGKIDVRGY